MEIKANTSFDGTPLFSELFKTQAYIKTLASVLLTSEQKDEFNKLYSSKLKEVIIEFLDNYPNVISDADELRKNLGKE